MTTLQADLKFLFAHPAHLIAFGFGTGLAPKAPGTVGTLLGLPLYWLTLAIAPDLANQLIFLLATFLLGVWACGRTGRALGVADHGGMVWDEIVAFAVVLMFTPALMFTSALPNTLKEWAWIALAFALFRLFDILKPWPIRLADTRLKNGFGVMFDDLLAAAYAIAALKGLQWLV